MITGINERGIAAMLTVIADVREYCKCGAIFRGKNVPVIALHIWKADHPAGPEHGPCTPAQTYRAQRKAEDALEAERRDARASVCGNEG